MKALLEKLRAACADAPAEMLASALMEMGFVPKAQGEGVLISAHNLGAIAGALGLKPEQLTGDMKGIDFGAAKAEAAKSTRAEIVSILEVCALGGKESMAIDLIKSGTTLADARTKVIEAKAAASNSTVIKNTVTALGTGEVSPLIIDAKSRAEAAKK